MRKTWYKILPYNNEYFKLMFSGAYVPPPLRKIKLMIQTYVYGVILVSVNIRYTSILHLRS